MQTSPYWATSCPDHSGCHSWRLHAQNKHAKEPKSHWKAVRISQEATAATKQKRYYRRRWRQKRHMVTKQLQTLTLYIYIYYIIIYSICIICIYNYNYITTINDCKLLLIIWARYISLRTKRRTKTEHRLPNRASSWLWAHWNARQWEPCMWSDASSPSGFIAIHSYS